MKRNDPNIGASKISFEGEMRLPGGLGAGVGARAGSGLMSGNAASPADEDGAARCAEGSSEEDVRHRRQKVEEDVRFFCDSRMWRGGTLTRPCEVFSQPLPTPPPPRILIFPGPLPAQQGYTAPPTPSPAPSPATPLIICMRLHNGTLCTWGAGSFSRSTHFYITLPHRHLNRRLPW